MQTCYIDDGYIADSETKIIPLNTHLSKSTNVLLNDVITTLDLQIKSLQNIEDRVSVSSDDNNNNIEYFQMIYEDIYKIEKNLYHIIILKWR